MRRGEMPIGSTGRSSGRSQNGETEPFLVEQISGSPIMRGRRQNPEAEPFPVNNISRSPVMRGRRQNAEEHFLVENIPRSPVNRRRQYMDDERFSVKETCGNSISDERVPRASNANKPSTSLSNQSSNVSGWNSSNDTTDNPIGNTMATTSSSISVTIPPHSETPDNDDAPPSYESSIPPNQIGWLPDITCTVPFPLPYSSDHDSEKSKNTFAYSSMNPYPSADAYPPIELTPMAKSSVSVASSYSKSPLRSTSPSLSPSPDRLLRPAYSYEHNVRVVRTPTRPPFTRVPGDENGHFPAKRAQNEFSYKYGAVIIAAFFVAFMMILSLAVKFFIRNSFH